MRNIFRILLWPLCICVYVAAVLGAHAWKWPRQGDVFVSLKHAASGLAGSLPIDSPVALRVVGLPEDYFNHLRYEMIPRPLEMKMQGAKRVVLLAADSAQSAAVARLKYERPDMRLISSQRGPGFQLSFYKPEL